MEGWFFDIINILWVTSYDCINGGLRTYEAFTVPEICYSKSSFLSGSSTVVEYWGKTKTTADSRVHFFFPFLSYIQFKSAESSSHNIRYSIND